MHWPFIIMVMIYILWTWIGTKQPNWLLFGPPTWANIMDWALSVLGVLSWLVWNPVGFLATLLLTPTMVVGVSVLNCLVVRDVNPTKWFGRLVWAAAFCNLVLLAVAL